VRLQAEMENLRRRTAKDLESAHKFALEKFAKALLEITDSMAMGIKSANEENADVATIKDGIEMTNKLTLDILAKFEITSINPKQGDDLNPELHEAISIIPNPKLKSNTVVEVVQVGWQLSGRVLRPAMVMVAQ
jgi:molecular chaperone GrpE